MFRFSLDVTQLDAKCQYELEQNWLKVLNPNLAKEADVEGESICVLKVNSVRQSSTDFSRNRG